MGYITEVRKFPSEIEDFIGKATEIHLLSQKRIFYSTFSLLAINFIVHFFKKKTFTNISASDSSEVCT
jgi:hypothetical protein